MTPPQPDTASPSDPPPAPATNDAPPVKKSNGKKKKKKSNSPPATNAAPAAAERTLETAPPAPATTESAPAAAQAEPTAPTAATDAAVPAAQAPAGEDDGGLFGGWTTGLTEGMNQLWGSVSGEGELGAAAAGSAATAKQARAAGGNTAGEGEEESTTPLRSPALIPLSKAAAELEQAGKAAQIRLGKAAQEVEKGWGAFNSFLDEFLSPPIAADDTEAARSGTAAGMGMGQRDAYENASEKLHDRFPQLDTAEEAVEVYECSLIQKYKSALNEATPEKTFAFAGVLYITPAHIAMYVVDDNTGKRSQPFGFVVPLADIKRVQRGSKAMLRIVTADKNSYVFASFANEDAFKATVELLHHLVGADEAKPQAAAPVQEEQPAADAAETTEATTTA